MKDTTKYSTSRATRRSTSGTASAEGPHKSWRGRHDHHDAESELVDQEAVVSQGEDDGDLHLMHVTASAFESPILDYPNSLSEVSSKELRFRGRLADGHWCRLIERRVT